MLRLPPPAADDAPMQLVSACPHPFETRRFDYLMPAGLTIAEIVERIQPDPVLAEHGYAFLGEHMIPRDRWHLVRPRPGQMLSIRLVPSGGNAGRIIGLVAVAILIVVAVVFQQYWAVGLLVSAGMMLAQPWMTPAPPQTARNQAETPSYAITGQRNDMRNWAKVPFLLGRFNLTPPYAAAPYREVVGGEIYWRTLFAFSHGPIDLEALYIGETALGNFREVEYQLRRGYWSLPDTGGWSAGGAGFPASASFGDTYTCTVAGSVGGESYAVGETITFNALADPTLAAAWDRDQGKPFSLYPSDVYEEPFNIAVPHETPAIRTSEDLADELGIEIVFERGIVHIENQPAGRKKDTSIALRIEQAPTGSGNWSTVLYKTITGRQSTPLYWGHAWKPSDVGPVDVNKKYDVRITRLSGNSDEERNFGNFSWIALRTLTYGDPAPVPGVAMMAMRIRASEQLQGVLDTFNVVARTIARDWDATIGQWIWRPTSSPAALFRHILQHPTREIPATDDQLDLARLQYWDGITRPANRQFNGVIEAKGSLYDVLVKIARVGRAMPTLRDLKFSVMIDEPKTVPVRLFTPRNSWNYSGEMSHALAPHGYRIGYVDAAQNWRTDEVVVYDDGYTAANATRIDGVDWVGITSRDQAWKEGRFHVAQQRLRREVHKISVDFEQLACERGDLVALQHDVIAVGIGSSRIKATTEIGARVFDVTLEDAVTMQSGKSYGLRARRIVGGVMRTDLYRVNTVPGVSRHLYLSDTPLIVDAPAVGDLCAFGLWGTETLRLLVRDIEPQQDLSAVLTLIAEAPGVHTAENGPIPPYDPGVTKPLTLPAPIVLGIFSDARVMFVTPSRTLIDRVIFTLQPISIEGAETIVLYRLAGTGGAWLKATVQEETPGSVAVIGLTSGETYDFRLQHWQVNYFASPMTAINSYYVIGRVGAPADLVNMTLAIVGGQALLRWDLPADLDVQYGGWVMFRHSPDMDATLWPNTTSLARAVTGDQTHVYLPLKPGTYFARVYDADGRPSANFIHVSTKQASVLAFTPVDDVVEDPLFTGTKTRCHLIAGGLTLDAEDFDAIPDIDAEPFWDISGGVASSGLYQFAAGIDMGSVTRARITSHVLLEALNEHDFWDAKIGEIDTWPDVDGTLGASVDATVYGKLTDDNPAGSPTWGPAMRIDSAEITARAVGHIECRMGTADRAFNLWLQELRVAAEKVV